MKEEPRRPTSQPAAGAHKSCSTPAPEGFPSSYGVDRIIIQLRDPWWIHAYWELLPATVARGRKSLGEEGESADLTLRIYEEGTSRFFDLLLNPEAKERPLQVEPGRGWVVEIGLKSGSGRFIPLARSNSVRTPPDRSSGGIGEKASASFSSIYRHSSVV